MEIFFKKLFLSQKIGKVRIRLEKKGRKHLKKSRLLCLTHEAVWNVGVSDKTKYVMKRAACDKTPNIQ